MRTKKISFGQGAVSSSIRAVSGSGQGELYLLSRWSYFFANLKWVCPTEKFGKPIGKCPLTTVIVCRICPCPNAMSATTFKGPGRKVADIEISYKSHTEKMSMTISVTEVKSAPFALISMR